MISNISVFITGFNEISHLNPNLDYLCQNFKDVNYFDLGSTDGSIEYAKTLTNCQLIQINKEENVEIIHYKHHNLLLNDWILYIDPDEYWPQELFYEIYRIVKEDIDNDLGLISSDIQYFFGKKALRGTRWGGIKTRGILFHRNRVILSEDVHRAKRLRSNYRSKHIGGLTIQHFWMSGYGDFYKKHLRYIKKEGESRFNNNLKTNIFLLLSNPFRSFYFCYISKRGYLDGVIGLFLSIFWAFYDTKSNINLICYARNKTNDNNDKSE